MVYPKQMCSFWLIITNYGYVYLIAPGIYQEEEDEGDEAAMATDDLPSDDNTSDDEDA